MKKMILVMALAAAGWVTGAPKAASFEKVPDAAVKALKIAKGKPFTAGLAFVGGHYLKPPYVVSRKGTALYINNVQVTDQIVSWRSFLATQEGGAALAPRPAPAPKPAAPAKSDDLFDDTPAPAAKAEAEPAAETVAEAEAAFTANAQSDKLLKKINDARTAANRALREGGICFWGKGYGRVKVPPRLVKPFLAEFPELLRDANDGADLANKLRAKGFAFMTKELCEDLIANRADYFQLVERRQKLKAEAELQSFINKSSQGGNGL